MSQANSTQQVSGQGTGPGASAPRSPAQPGAFRIVPLKDPERKRYLKWLIYGPPGAGKSTLLASAVDVEAMNDVLYVSIEGGELSLEDNDRVKNEAKIDLIRMEQIEQLQKLLDFIKLHVKFRDTNDEATLARLQAQVFGIVPDNVGKTGGTPWPTTEELKAKMGRIRRYHTVIIDSLTEIERKNLAKIQGLDNVTEFEVGSIEVAGWGEFRQNNHTMQRIVRAFRDQPIHLGLVCEQAYTQDEKKVFHYGPSLTGKLSVQMQGFVDIVGYLCISQGAAEEMGDQNPAGSSRRRLYVQPVAGVRFDAKCRRSSYKKAYFNDPTMADIMSAFNLGKVA